MSNKVIYYRQCRLEKKVEGGSKQQVSYIPDQFAVVGKVLKLRDSDKNWEDGWVVLGAGGKRAEHELPDFHELIKGHLRATGDTEPKRTNKK